MNDHLPNVIQQLHESQGKYTYFLIVFAGSCIALCIKRTTGVPPAWDMIPLAVAVLFWALSILCGLRNRDYFQSTLYANAKMLIIQSGEDPEVGNRPAYISAASEGIRQACESNSNKGSWFGNAQFNFLIAGSVMFIIWHILTMFLL